MMANHGRGSITSQGTISAEKQQSIANAQFNASQVIGKMVATTLKGVQKEVSGLVRSGFRGVRTSMWKRKAYISGQ